VIRVEKVWSTAAIGVQVETLTVSWMTHHRLAEIIHAILGMPQHQQDPMYTIRLHSHGNPCCNCE